MIAEIVTVGEELLLGSTVNTNAAWLGERLDRLGFRTRRVVTVGDDLEAISAAVESSIGSSDLVVVTGGLGPTHDDVTKKALADLLGVDLVIDPVVEEELRARFERRGRAFTAGRRSMASKPEG
ncbi:MAG TPA: competence/damage-inducible protein A, partial [Rhodothermia bacterium]|nr:competence/damage-inducible protein A [Rhodothermia bacterium]